MRSDDIYYTLLKRIYYRNACTVISVWIYRRFDHRGVLLSVTLVNCSSAPLLKPHIRNVYNKIRCL